MFFVFFRGAVEFSGLELYMVFNCKSEGALEGKRISIITAKAVLRILFLILIFIFHSSDNFPALCGLSLLPHLKCF